MLRDRINNIYINKLKVKNIIKKIETKTQELQKEKHITKQMKLIDSINKYRNKYLTLYWASYIGYLQNIKDKKFLETEKIIGQYDGNYNNAVYNFFIVFDCLKDKDKLQEKYGKRFLELAHNQKLLYSSNKKLFEEEQTLRKEYRKILNDIRVDFNNEKLSLVKLTPYLTDTDSTVRKEAYDKRYNALLEVSDSLSEIFLKILDIRKQIAKSANFDNYRDYSYVKMNRVDYTKKDLDIFKESIIKYFVPLREKLKTLQAKRLREKELSYYNASILFRDGNAKSKYGLKGIIRELKKIFNDISTEYGELFEFMIDNELIDLEERENKSAGGITTYLPDLKVPIFIKRYQDNSNNFIAITHEFGHSLQLYLNREKHVHENRWPTFDICEIHSTTMELLVSDYADKIYKEDANKHLINHYTNLIEIIVRTACVDDFKTRIYSEDINNIDEVKNIWKDCYKKYYPSNNYDLDYFNEGIMWQADINRVDDPFYGIDYALATIYAISFYQKYSVNKKKGIQEFTSFCHDGGEIFFKDIATKYKLLSPFKEKDLIEAADFLDDLINKII